MKLRVHTEGKRDKGTWGRRVWTRLEGVTAEEKAKGDVEREKDNDQERERDLMLTRTFNPQVATGPPTASPDGPGSPSVSWYASSHHQAHLNHLLKPVTERKQN